ncbi:MULTISPECIES: chromosome segregation protein SMC [unclassified Agarivorans]|uniref:chromosome segregation protein SMC n=1 Tax=unclassified Agarivorans TaxID=2636026 RepID=UPI003D7CADC8
MRLKQIRLAGFKSFVDRTTIPFPTDMTAIVGPNGCGKSNVIDAVRWVLGESNARHLRGGAMTDVIFNGSTKRAAVSKAMVELIFDNSQGRIGGEFASYAEIAVRREVSRDGQNHYQLNGSKCRKRDITDLFLGTGLGPRSYAIIEQGMISRLIESKPQELRVFIEEAAGVSKYKERRRETELRIKHTDENILRLRDIESELAQQVNKLKTQAQAAKRYRQYRARHRELKALLCLQELRKLDNSIDGGEQYHADAEQKQRAEEHLLSQCENQSILLANQIAEQQQLQQNLQQQHFELRTQLAKLEQQQLHTKQQQSLSQQAQQQNIEQQQALEQNLALLETQRVQEQLNLQQLEAEMDLQQQLMLEMMPQLEAAEQRHRQLKAEQGSASAQQQQVQQQLRQTESQLGHCQQMQQRHQQQISQLQHQLSTLVAVDVEQIALLQQQLQQGEAQQEQLQQQFTQVSNDLQQQRAELEQLKLQQQQLQLTYTAEQTRLQGVNKLLAQVDSKAKRPLMDVLGVSEGWQRAADVVLAGWLQAEWCEQLDSDYPLALSAVAAPLKLPRAPQLQGLASLAEHLENVELSYLCEPVLLVESLTQAFELREYLSPHQSLITPQGEWLGKYWQRLKVSHQQLSVLSWQQERQHLQQRLAEIKQQDERLEQQLKQQSQNIERLQQQQQHEQFALDTLITEQADCRSRFALLEQQQLFSQQQQQQLSQQVDELNVQLEQDQESQLLLEEQLELQQAELDEAQFKLTQLQQQNDTAADSVKQLGHHAQQQQTRLHELQLAIQKQQAQYANQQQQQHYQQQRLQELAEQLLTQPEVSSEQLEILAEQIEQLLEQSLVIEDQQSVAASAYQQSIAEQQQLQQSIKQAQLNLKQLVEAGTERRIQQQNLLARRSLLLEQLAEQGENLKHLELSLPEASLEDDYATELAQLDQRLKRLGAVNLAAEEEYDQQNSRYQELSAQLLDLESAIEVLRAAIMKIDRQTRSKFSETFAKVDADLQLLFPKVFGGGKAWLELSSDDLLETGVTIMARPPGKKNASISLLSGGEKALTALALVFAIFRLNPAPFCMLDEVDAPLDEVNVGRFADLVHSMSDSVQFIFISHNKVTMEKASQLAGVTMQEPGVSRLVAVDIAEAIAMVE